VAFFSYPVNYPGNLFIPIPLFVSSHTRVYPRSMASIGPLRIERYVKPDGRALILYVYVREAEAQQK
jgi:hypothetical protein